MYLTIEGEVIVTTAEHPFYTAAGEWVEAGDLVVGEEIRTAEWETGTVEAMYIVTQPQPMYNFTVSAAHTYFVGNGQWLVHNAGCGHLNPQILRGKGAIAGRQHIDPINLGLDGISAYCSQCIDASTRKWWGRSEEEIRAFAGQLGLDPTKAVSYTPQFGGDGHYSLFLDAMGLDGKLLPQYADAIDDFLRTGVSVP